MSTPDLTFLIEYYASAQGETTRTRLCGHIQYFINSGKEETCVGIGYCIPYINDERAFSSCWHFLPGELYRQKDILPEKGSVIDSAQFPVRKDSTNRILVIHGLEYIRDPYLFLQNIWNLLVPMGRVLLIVPNRMGLWARLTSTPFGYGTPFSLAQLEQLLQESQFHLLHARPALFMPPVTRRQGLRSSALWRIITRWLLRPVGGVWIVEAEKRLYAEIPETETEKSGLPLPVRPAFSREYP
ncbi:MAG: hypothetical protein H6908_00570 [Hyphomicrobiales bacterium]|nr:hypothetical protein [Hyphomicrobiales bacterium]